MRIDRREVLRGALSAALCAALSPRVVPTRPLLLASPADRTGLRALLDRGPDAGLAPLALCDVSFAGEGPELSLVEPDGRRRTAPSPAEPDALARTLALLVLPDRSALARYAAARPGPVIELLQAAADGRMAREAVDVVLANLVRSRVTRWGDA